MAKQNKINKKRAKRRARKFVERQDYRQGGRVAFQRGGPRREEEELTYQLDSPPVETGRLPQQPVQQPVQQPTTAPFLDGTVRMPTGAPVTLPPGAGSIRPTVPSPTTLPGSQLFGKIKKRPRPKDIVYDAAQGITPEATRIPDPVQVEEGAPQQVTEMAQPTEVQLKEAAQVSPEQVVRGDVQQAQTPEQIRAAQMEAAKVDTEAQVDVATGTVSDEAIAEAAGVDRVPTIEAAEVEVPIGALTDRVVGTLSDEAKSLAAQNTGSSLRKLSRAKKQLRKAGLTEDQIGEIGDDIETLEDRLDDFTEEQRGIIAGVDADTLVDAQMSRLLDGMEEGQIPLWAQGAVGRVEQMLASRGLSASSVGRAELTNAILQAALPMAQSNATALQQAATQQRDIEARESESNAARRQQTALTNANNVFQMDMANFSAEVQRQASNSKFLQTVGLQEASFEQQGIVQDALLMSQANLAEADFYQKAQIQNAQAFLQTDMANLNNLQQANVLKAQQEQQRLLSNQSSQNAARNANMVSENQTQQFMAGLNAQTKQFNAQQSNAMKQFNAAAENSAAARDANRDADMNKFNAQLLTQVEEFNSQQDFARNQWEAQNTAVVEASNVEWRRIINTVNTAAQNQVNMQNAMNAYGLSTQSLSFLWQELRDNADYDFRSAENAKAQVTQLRATAIANEAALAEKSKSTIDQIVDIVEGMIGNYYDV